MLHHLPIRRCHMHRQNGAVLMVMLVIVIIGAITFLVTSLSSSALQIKRDKTTADALAQAKEALIGFAVKAKISKSNTANQPRPGDLPCPDRNDNGEADDGPCGNAAGSNPASRLGRLPWKTLGLPDLRDGSGERLWYAVSNNFKHNERTALLNSDTPGTITIRGLDGSILHDGSSGNGVVAVIIAPGAVLKRTDSIALQNRSGTANMNMAINYLDTANGEDNAAFLDDTTDGFIQGSIRDINGNAILNDQLLAVTQDNIMQAAQKRVAAEVRKCLNEYADAAANNGRYPWAVPLDDLSDYKDNNNELFGRIPDDLTKTGGGTGMSKEWGSNCNTHNLNAASTWWQNWREMVFYALADDYKPDSDPIMAAPCASSGACLSVNPPSAMENKKFVVIVAGKELPGQARNDTNDKKQEKNYLEGENEVSPTSFEQQPPSPIINDTVVFEQ